MKDCPHPLRQNEEYYCRACGRRWCVDEDKPSCDGPPPETISPKKRKHKR